MSTAERRYEILLAEEAERARARTVFAFGMVGGLGLTLAGNLATPLVSSSVPLALVTFSLPPLLAGWGAHVALTVHRAAPRTETGKRAAKGAVVLAVLLFAIALIASYAHLRELFILGGFTSWLASIFAAAIDLGLLTVTAAWFAMRPASDAELRAARAEIEAEVEAAETAERLAREDAERARNAEIERQRLADELARQQAESASRVAERAQFDARHASWNAPAAPEPAPRYLAQAHAVHADGIAKRVSVEKLAAALELLDADETNGAVERGSGVHRDTVGKLREWLGSERAA